jgi:hypothetical protein
MRIDSLSFSQPGAACSGNTRGCRRFGVLINRDDDRLHMMIAVTLKHRLTPHVGERLNPRLIVCRRTISRVRGPKH